MGVLSGWRFCPRCGARLTHAEGRVQCASCGFVYFANPVPAVSALVTDVDGRVLLARRAVDPDAGLWDTPGGFLDEGEAPEAGLRRELLEEAGIEIALRDFFGIYPDRYGDDDDSPFVLNLVWEAAVVSGNPVPADDVSELRWFAPDEIPPDTDLAFRWLARALQDWASAT